jgi:hypothetical protein
MRRSSCLGNHPKLGRLQFGKRAPGKPSFLQFATNEILQNGFDFDTTCQPHPKNPNNGGGAGGSCDNIGDNVRRCCGEYPQEKVNLCSGRLATRNATGRRKTRPLAKLERSFAIVIFDFLDLELKRFPYDDKAGCMQCCDAASKIYNVNRHGCCDGILGTVGCV